MMFCLRSFVLYTIITVYRAEGALFSACPSAFFERTAIQMIVVNISYLLITGMLNQFGVSVAAAAGVGLKVNTFAGMPCWAMIRFCGNLSGASAFSCFACGSRIYLL